MMIVVVWLVFLVANVILLLVVLMNFLMAIVADTYVVMMENERSNVYYFKNELCHEFIEIKGDNIFPQEFNMILFQQPKESAEIVSVLNVIKQTK